MAVRSFYFSASLSLLRMALHMRKKYGREELLQPETPCEC